MIGFDIVVGKTAFAEIIKKVDALSVEDIAKSLVGDIQKNIGSSTDLRGSGLKKLTPLTIRSKRSKGYSLPSKPLYATGKLYKSIYYRMKGKNEAEVILRNRSGISNETILDYQKNLDRQIFGVSARWSRENKQRYKFE